MARTVNLTLNDLTLNEANLILFALDATRAGKVVEINVIGDQQHQHDLNCATGACAIPAVSEPVAIETPYKPNDEVVEAVYDVEKPKKQKRTKKGAKKELPPAVEPTFDAPPVEVQVVEAAPVPLPLVAVPSVTKVDVDAALGEVAKKGMTVARSLLTEFAVARSRDLTPEQYPAFIARAKEIAK